mgnify:CR=1 FL=1
MKKFLIPIFVFLLSFPSFPQVTGGSALIPGELSWKLGFGGGFSYGFSNGSLFGHCGYDFKNLSGPGFYISLNASMPINYESDVYALVSYQSFNLESTEEMMRIKAVYGEPAPVEIKMESKAKVDVSSINLNLWYKRKIFSDFFVLGGLAFHFILDNEINQDETIKDDNFVFYGSEKTSDLIYKGEIDNLNSFQFFLSCGFGYDFRIGYKYILTPIFYFNYPLTKFVSDNSLKLMDINLGLQFSYLF